MNQEQLDYTGGSVDHSKGEPSFLIALSIDVNRRRQSTIGDHFQLTYAL